MRYLSNAVHCLATIFGNMANYLKMLIARSFVENSFNFFKCFFYKN
jgi:hypothetical protein